MVILDRPRHAELVKQVRRVGACIHMISDGDVAAAVATAAPGHGNVDVLLGIGGTPEGVIAAAALRCLGGEIQARLPLFEPPPLDFPRDYCMLLLPWWCARGACGRGMTRTAPRSRRRGTTRGAC